MDALEAMEAEWKERGTSTESGVSRWMLVSVHLLALRRALGDNAKEEDRNGS